MPDVEYDPLKDPASAEYAYWKLRTALGKLFDAFAESLRIPQLLDWLTRTKQ